MGQSQSEGIAFADLKTLREHWRDKFKGAVSFDAPEDGDQPAPDDPGDSDLATERERREAAPKANPSCRDCGTVDENTQVDGLCLRCSEKRRLATDFAPEDGDLP